MWGALADTVDPPPLEALPTLEALLQENAELQAENAALRTETVEYGLEAKINNGPDPQSTAALRARLEALKHEHDSLRGVIKLGDELQELHSANAKLREEAVQLQDKNKNLRTQNTALRAKSKQTTAVKGMPGESPTISGLEPQAAEISAAVGRGDMSKLNSCNEEERKELVAAMLNALTAAPIKPVRGVTQAPAISGNTKTKTSAAKGEKKNQALAPTTNTTNTVPVAPGVGGKPEQDKNPIPPRLPAALVGDVSPELLNATPSHPSMPASNTLPKQSKNGQVLEKANTGPVGTIPITAPVLAHTKSAPLERRAQEIAEALRRGDSQALHSCSDSERKELVAEMLRQGLFRAPSPRSIAAEPAPDPGPTVTVETPSVARSNEVRENGKEEHLDKKSKDSGFEAPQEHLDIKSRGTGFDAPQSKLVNREKSTSKLEKSTSKLAGEESKLANREKSTSKLEKSTSKLAGEEAPEDGDFRRDNLVREKLKKLGKQ